MTSYIIEPTMVKKTDVWVKIMFDVDGVIIFIRRVEIMKGFEPMH